MITIEQLKEIQQRAEKLKQYLAIDEKRVQLEEEELRTQAGCTSSGEACRDARRSSRCNSGNGSPVRTEAGPAIQHGRQAWRP